MVWSSKYSPIYLLFLAMKNPQNLMLIVKLLFISKIPAFVATGMETQATNLTSVFLKMVGLRCASYKDNMLQNQAYLGESVTQPAA